MNRKKYPLELKISMSKKRIKSWLNKFGVAGVYIAFSGGKDSTVLAHLVNSVLKEDYRYRGKIPLVFADTGLEFPEIRNFCKSKNAVFIKPKMNFKTVIDKYGYPIISKEQAQYISELQRGTTEYMTKYRLGKQNNTSGVISKKWQWLINSGIKVTDKCCDVMKKRPFRDYEKTTNRVPFVGIMGNESRLRNQSEKLYGCNIITDKKVVSRPILFWTEKDIWNYINRNNIEYCNIYDKGYKRTGCMFCGFGAHLEKTPNRFQLMQKTHPRQYEYCMNSLKMKDILHKINVSVEDKQLYLSI